MAVSAAPRRPRLRPPVRTASLVARCEWQNPARIVTTAFTAGLMIFMYTQLWSAVYCPPTDRGCAEALHAQTYSALAVLLTCTRGAGRDSVRSRIRDGTLIFWFVRPMPPRRYLAVRAVGAVGYNLLWLVPGAVLLSMVGVVAPPATPATFLVAVCCLLVGQVVTYQLGLVVELVCFWTLTNDGVSRTYYFLEDLLSGAAVPLWLMPATVVAGLTMLPFPAVIHTPLTVYLAPRLEPAHWTALGVSLAWAVVLGMVTRAMWRAAAHRVVTDGG